MDKNIIILEYKETLEENISEYVLGQIAQKKLKKQCYYENIPKKRDSFEKTMNYFSLKCRYISQTRIDKTKNKQTLARKISFEDILKILNSNKELLNDLKFRSYNFIENFDILDEIKTTSSIGLCINKNDNLDLSYLNAALNRLNKYVKKPVVYLFLDIYDYNIEQTFKKLNYPHKIITDLSQEEKFYFLVQCKHQIVLDSNPPSSFSTSLTNPSYSLAFWASLLNNKSYSIKILNAKFANLNKNKLNNLKVKNLIKNWIVV